MPDIRVSDETYKRLESLARPFQDRSPEDVINRALDALAGSKDTAASAAANGSDLVSHVGRVPHGSRLRASYKGRMFEAEVRDGRVHWNGKTFDSLSSAAVAVIQSTGSQRPTENGWRFWEVQTPGNSRWLPGTGLQR